MGDRTIKFLDKVLKDLVRDTKLDKLGLHLPFYMYGTIYILQKKEVSILLKSNQNYREYFYDYTMKTYSLTIEEAFAIYPTYIELLEDKFDIAAKTSYANYSFMFGGTNDNLEELLKTDPKKVAAIKLFLGSSTGNMLIDDKEVLKKIFSSTKMLIAVHCEDEETIRKNLTEAKAIYGDDIPMEMHPIIRSEEACYLSSAQAIALAK